MASEPVQQTPWPTIKDRNVATPSRVKLTKVELDPAVDDVYDVEPITGTVVEEGTPINKDLFEQIKSYVDTKEVVVPLATTQVPGIVQPDGTSIKVSAGNISVPTASASELGLVKADNATIINTSGTLSARVATGSATGVVKPDGSSITVDANGTITAHTTSATVNPTLVVRPTGTNMIDNEAGYKMIRCNDTLVSSNNWSECFDLRGDGGIFVKKTGWYRIDMSVSVRSVDSAGAQRVSIGVATTVDLGDQLCSGTIYFVPLQEGQITTYTYRLVPENAVLCLSGRLEGGSGTGSTASILSYSTQFAVHYLGAEVS